MSPRAGLLATLLLPTLALAQAQSAREHVPPAPPATQVHDMSYAEMVEMMGMDDRARFTKVMFDELEWRKASESAFGWDAAAWHGGDVHKVWLATEGERQDGESHARTELLWDRVATRWWNTRAGVRRDTGDGPERTWAAVGVAGLAPGFIDVEASVYVGESGRTALRVQADYDLLLTQRLVLHPEIELNVYGRDDPARLIGSGLSDVEAGLRLRYELRREFAPYIGLAWERNFSVDASEWRWLAGIRAWF
ncbi:MAG: copper resistance protein B [Steroidobacteraceae bacterium]|nr:copper resistance protein B [Steroidobacteraceae bacterium]